MFWLQEGSLLQQHLPEGPLEDTQAGMLLLPQEGRHGVEIHVGEGRECFVW